MTPYNITLLNNKRENNYSESYILEELEYYIKEIGYNKNLQNEISKNLLHQFIKNDDIYLEKLLRKILIINKRKVKKLLLIYFHRWYINSITIFKDNRKNNKEETIIITYSNIKINENNLTIPKNNKTYSDKINNNKILLTSLISNKIKNNTSIKLINHKNKKKSNSETNLKLVNIKKNLFIKKNSNKTDSLINNKSLPNINRYLDLSFHNNANNYKEKSLNLKSNHKINNEIELKEDEYIIKNISNESDDTIKFDKEKNIKSNINTIKSISIKDEKKK